MKKIGTKIISIITAFALTVTCINAPAKDVEASVKTNMIAMSKWTFAMYLCGSNLESEDGSATGDIIEILTADVDTMKASDVDIIIETGGSYRWHYKEYYGAYLQDMYKLNDDEIDEILEDEIDAKKIQRYYVDFGYEYTNKSGEKINIPRLVHLEDVGYNDPDYANSISMSDADTLEEFVDYVQSRFPGRKMALDIWNHGGGIATGACVDEYVRKPISVPGILGALDGALSESGKRFDVIGFDACLMSNYEIWNGLSKYADYGVGSLTSEPGDGWYYTPFIEKMCDYDSYSGEQLSEDIVKAYEQYYDVDGIYEALGYESAEAMLCAVDLMNLASTATSFDQWAKELTILLSDNEGIKDLCYEIHEKDTVDTELNAVGFEGLLAISEEFATDRANVLSKSKKEYEKYLSGVYEDFADDCYTLNQNIEDALIYCYDGHEDSINKGQGRMSIFFPERGEIAADLSMFNLESYPDLAVSSSYSTFVYYIAKGIEDKQYEDYDTTFSYNKKTDTISVNIPEENGYYSDFLGTQKFIEKDNKYYITSFNYEDAVSEFSEEVTTEYFEVNGKPVMVDVQDYGTFAFYTLGACINGVSGSITLVKVVSDSSYYFFRFDPDNAKDYDPIYDLQTGDKVKFAYIEANEAAYYNAAARNEIKKFGSEYTMSASDMKYTYIYYDEGSFEFTLPFKKKNCDNNDLYYVLISGRNAFTKDDKLNQDIMVVNYGELLDYANATVSLEKNSYELTGEKICPNVTVKSVNTTFAENKDYKVSYSNNIGIGKGSVKVSGMGQFGLLPDVTLTFDITKPSANTKEVVKEVIKKEIVVTPKAPKLKSVKNNKKKSVAVKFNKVKGAKGYEVQYALNKKFTKGKKKVTTTKNSVVIKKLKKKKTYFVRVRAYVVDSDGTKHYGDFGNVKKVKVRK